MKPSSLDHRLGPLTMPQYLGLTEGMSARVAGRMVTLAGDYSNDAIRLHDEALDPRLDGAALARLGRAATGIETRLAQLLVLAAEHCQGQTLVDLPEAVRAHIKIASRCRSAICALAISAEQHGRDERLAA
jgi:hypothetical protein